MVSFSILDLDDPRACEAWDRFVSDHPGGTCFHRTAWARFVRAASRFLPLNLMATEGATIRGVLPLFEARGLLLGRALVSTPFAVYGGPLGGDARTREALAAEARRLAEKRGARHVEYRNAEAPLPALRGKDLYVRFEKEITGDPEADLKAIPRKQRRMVRVSLKQGYEARYGWEHLGDFYDAFVESRRRLGTPPYSRFVFEAARDAFGEDAELMTVWKDGRFQSGVITFYDGTTVRPYYGALSDQGLRSHAGDFMYWTLMVRAGERGCRRYDFGRSRRDTGPYHYKRHWGFEPQPLPYQWDLVRAKEPPSLNPSNPKMAMFIKTWQRLPLFVERAVGPWLCRWLPLD